MENQHRKISGYRELSQQEVDLINRIKAAGGVLVNLQKEVVDFLTAQQQIKTHAQETLIDHEALAEAITELNRFRAAEPGRWAAIAKTDIQTGVMALVRAVAQPAD